MITNMLNLLPKEEKKNILMEYHLKVLWISLFLLSCLFVIALVGILPSYLNEKIKVDTITQEKIQRDQQRNNPVNIALQKQATDNNALADYLQKQTVAIGSPVISPAIQEVLSKKIAAVKINTFVFSDKSLVITGVADNRTDLTSFYQSLKGGGYFASADLPIEDIAKSKDNNFTIKLTLK